MSLFGGNKTKKTKKPTSRGSDPESQNIEKFEIPTFYSPDTKGQELAKNLQRGNVGDPGSLGMPKTGQDLKELENYNNPKGVGTFSLSPKYLADQEARLKMLYNQPSKPTKSEPESEKFSPEPPTLPDFSSVLGDTTTHLEEPESLKISNQEELSPKEKQINQKSEFPAPESKKEEVNNPIIVNEKEAALIQKEGREAVEPRENSGILGVLTQAIKLTKQAESQNPAAVEANVKKEYSSKTPA